MKKRILTFLCFIFMTFGLFTGCSGFIASEESLYISNITSEVLEDGTTKVTIIYEDEELSPTVFYIPKGEQGDKGDKGNGIYSINYETNEETGEITVTIIFTSSDMEPVSFKLYNGVSMTGINSYVDEETGTTYFEVEFSDGSKSEPIEVPKGEKGEDGSYLIDYGVVQNEEDGSQVIYFTFSTGEFVSCTIPKPEKGEDGRGIKSIIGSEDDEYYYVTFEYTDDSEPTTLHFSRPENPNEWHTGSGIPSSILGKDGDFYFDVDRKDIYSKKNGVWIKIVDFDDSETLYTVEFNLNGENAKFPEGSNYSNYYTIPEGTSFASNNETIPIPVREGYSFQGWYTTRTPSIVNGMFNDLTIVSGDLTLYAKWELIG